MKPFRSILLLWLGSIAVFAGLLWLLPHDEVDTPVFLLYSIQWLLFIVLVFIVRSEPIRKNKVIFLNFSLFFALSIPFYLKGIVIPLFFGESERHLIGWYFTEYVMFGAYFLLLSFAIVYIAIDVLFRSFSILSKYALTFCVVAGFFGYYYHPIIESPDYLYHTPEINEFREFDPVFSGLMKSLDREPTREEFTAAILTAYGEPVYSVSSRASVIQEHAEFLYPYFLGANFKLLVMRPLLVNAMYMCVMSIGFILLFFGYQYVKDPPQGAYIEKIMFAFLVLCSQEIFHAWTMLKSIEWENFLDLWAVSQAFSVAGFVLIAVFFLLRLRFITSSLGGYYEVEIATSPRAITRWRDALDNIVITHFMNPKGFMARLFVDPNGN